MSRCRCCPDPVVAWYTVRLSFNTVGLCRRHLDMWLDNADDDPELEPAELVFVERSAVLGRPQLGGFGHQPDRVPR